MKFKILTILIFVFFFSVELVSAIGLGANPSFFDFELRIGQSKEAKILVFNISKEAGIFQVSPDELNDWIKIEPNNFRLEAGENKEVKIKILAKEEGRKATNISVLATPLERSSFSVGPGIKIPLKLNVGEERPIFLASLLAALNQNWPWLIIGILIICLILIFGIKYLKGRKLTRHPQRNYE